MYKPFKCVRTQLIKSKENNQIVKTYFSPSSHGPGLFYFSAPPSQSQVDLPQVEAPSNRTHSLVALLGGFSWSRQKCGACLYFTKLGWSGIF